MMARVSGQMASATASVRDVLRNRSIRRIELAWMTGTAADWALLVVLLIVAYDAGGAVAAGVLGAIRVVPAIIIAPFASTLVARYRGDRVLTLINVVRAVGAVATALVVASDLPVELTYGLAALVAGAGSLIRPIQSALLPAFARTPGELVASNVASSTGEGVGTFSGPLLAGLLVAWTGSTVASLLVAAGFAVAAAAVTGIRFEHASDARGGVSQDRVRKFVFAEAPRLLRRYPGTSVLIGNFIAQIFVRGVLITLIVVASIEVLDMGDTGVGLLNAAIGLGGLVGAIGALGLAGGKGLGRVYVLALAGWGLPLILIGAWPEAAIGLAALFATGISNAVLDISGFTLIQRGVANEDRVTLFSVFEGFLGIGLLLGSLAAPALIALLGPRGTFIAVGALLPALALISARVVVGEARRSAQAEDRIELLRRNELFAPLPLTALDRLAESMQPLTFATGDVVMRKGDVGEEYVLIAEGTVDVADEDRHLRTCGPGDGIGEIALLRRVPRTATVTAVSDVRAFGIDAPAFLTAVAGPTAAAAAEAVVTARLEASETVERVAPAER